MTFDVGLLAVLIFVARVIDIAMSTMRTAFIARGHRGAAFVLGFFGMLVWVVVIAHVITNLNHPVYAVAFALGSAAGTTAGITMEEWFAHGDQVVRVFTRDHESLAAALRADGHPVTEFEGAGRDGPVHLLFVQVPRRAARAVAERARGLDPTCFYVIDDVRRSSAGVALTSTSEKPPRVALAVAESDTSPAAISLPTRPRIVATAHGPHCREKCRKAEIVRPLNGSGDDFTASI
jgi:uncharacterized protein YebE (UPF0316 family)